MCFVQVFGRPLVKWFALCYRSVLSVCNLGVLWPNSWMDRDTTWCPCLLWPNGSIDQDATWYEGRRRPRRHCVRWRPSSPPPKKRGTALPNFWSMFLWPNGWIDEDTTWYEGRHRPRPHYVRWGPNSPPSKKGTSSNFRPMSIVAKPLDGSIPLGGRHPDHSRHGPKITGLPCPFRGGWFPV